MSKKIFFGGMERLEKTRAPSLPRTAFDLRSKEARLGGKGEMLSSPATLQAERGHTDNTAGEESD